MMIKIIAILALSSGIIASPFSRGNMCDRKKSEILRGIRRKDKQTIENFKINEEGEPERICGEGYEYKKDIIFCFDVCALKVGDTCLRSIEAGKDLCADDLECVSDDYDSHLPLTCQSL
ncbi:unnamed protein product, partial [Oikopleura dioica]